MRPRNSTGPPGCWPVFRNPRWPRSSIIWNNSKKHAMITATISLRSRDCWSRRNQEFALEYINDYLGTYATLDTTQYCQNPSSNALLNYYIQTAQSQGIAVNSSISLPQKPSCAGDRLLHHTGQPSLQRSGGMSKGRPRERPPSPSTSDRPANP